MAKEKSIKQGNKWQWDLPMPNVKEMKERHKAAQKLNTVRKGKLPMEVLNARIKKNLPRFDY